MNPGQTHITRWPRDLFLNFCLFLTSIIVAIFTIECAFRFHFQAQHNIPFFKQTDYRTSDPVLGWAQEFIWGDPQTHKFKIFLVGDSFTENNCFASPGHHYYEFLKKKLPEAEIFVFGAGGYGTLQEYLIIDRYIDKIRPDLLVLQFCSNDFINNSYVLENKSFIHNNESKRPYYENGEIVYRYSRGPVLLRELAHYSRIGYYFCVAFDKALAVAASAKVFDTIENDIKAQGLSLADFRESVKTTSTLIGMIRKRAGSIPLISFPVWSDEPFFGQAKKIFSDNQVIFLDRIPVIIFEVERKARSGRVNGSSHWSDVGHLVCGEYLAEYIRGHFLKNR